MSEGPRIDRVRHELKRRRLTVSRVESLPPGLIRVAFTGAELDGFTSSGFDDHVKVFLPSGEMRDFTPRRFDAAARELWIDFFLQAGGPAAAWAAQARPGQSLEIGGPKGSAVVRVEDIDAHVFVGDETALPAISRRLEELPSDACGLAVVEIDAAAARPVLRAPAAIEVIWVVRDSPPGAPAAALIRVLQTLTFPAGRCWFWAAAESRAVRAVRAYLRDARGIDKRWIKAAGYWQRGAAGAHDRVADEE
jgi:NADPH-dependent ferric siderophore reductase